MEDLKQAWVRKRAVELTSSDADAPLTADERTILHRIVDNATCIGIGEALHGSKTILQSAARILKFLIQEQPSSVLILESCFAATQTLNRHVVHGEGEANDALVELGNWNLSSREFLEFVNWLRRHNLASSGSTRPVRVFGCDCQSMDGPKAQLKRLLRGFVVRELLSASTAAETAALVDSLPTDRDLGKFVELVMQQLDAGDSNVGRTAEIEAWQVEFIPRTKASLAIVSGRLGEARESLPAADTDEDGFLFERCMRLLDQVIDFYSPGDAIAKRDSFMAENILAIQRRFQPDRTILLSHNVHVARIPLAIDGYHFVAMGHHLARRLGDAYRVIGSALYDGQYVALTEYRAEDTLIEDAHPAGPNTLESLLQKIVERETDGLLVDLGNSTCSPSPWPNGIEMRLGDSGRQRSYQGCFFNQRPELQFDGMFFLKSTSPITVLPEYYDRAMKQWRPV